MKLLPPPEDITDQSLMEADSVLSTDLLDQLGGQEVAQFKKYAPSDRKQSEFYIAFRAKLGEKAHHFKNGTRRGDWTAATVDWAWKDQTPKLQSMEYKRLSRMEKYFYDDARKLREKRSEVVRNAQKAFESGKFVNSSAAPSVRLRAEGGGPAVKFPEVEESLYNYFVEAYFELKGRVTSSLLRAKAHLLFAAIQKQHLSDGKVDPLPPDWQNDWLSKRLFNFRARYELSFRSKNQTWSLSYEECRRRLGMLWRNCIRSSAYFWPALLQWDAYDHTPTTRRLNTGKAIAPTGAEKVGFVEDNTGDHDRHTTVLWSSSDGRQFDPVICFKAKKPELLRDLNLKKIPKGIALQFSESGSYDEGATLDMLKNKLSSATMLNALSPTKGWRGLLFDQFDGQLTPKCIQLMLERKRIPSTIWGCLTGLTQPADKRQNQDWKATSKEVESEMVLQKLSQRPGGVAKLSRQELVQRAATTAQRAANNKLHLKMAAEFPRSGINLDLEGKHDELLDDHLRPWWDDKEICGGLSMGGWRKQYLLDTKATKEAEELKKKSRPGVCM